MTTVAEALQWAESTLKAMGSGEGADPAVDAAWLLGHVLGRNQAWLRAWRDHEIPTEMKARFEALITRRGAGEPVAYLTGSQGFWSLDLEVTADTLVPRPDTELLVECALELLDDAVKSVVDLGTGTGAIALALASERPRWQVSATDIDSATLALAQRNAERLRLPVRFVQSHWLQMLADEKFDLIISNPPYIRSDDPHLNGVGVRYEPLRALASGVDGLDAIREIIDDAPAHLFDGGWLMLEHGYDQGDAVRTLLHAAGWKDVETRQDLGGNDRMTMGRKP